MHPAPQGEPESNATADRGFVARVQILSSDDVRRALTRMAHEIVEHNHGTASLAIVGLQRGGVPLASRLAVLLQDIVGETVPLASLDVVWYRDDIGIRPIPAATASNITFNLSDRVVVLVDDVLYTGRTVRAGLDALSDLGRPRAVQLAVLVDRGHRELPIRPDYVGKNIPTRADELVEANEGGVWVGTLGVPQGDRSSL